MLEYKKQPYLVVVRYFAKYVELAKLTTTTSQDIIRHLKSIFRRHDIPVIVVSDNVHSPFDGFASEYGFIHVTSSPRYAQGNGMAEKAVQTLESLLKKSVYPYLALLTYRLTPLEQDYSLSELY